MSDHRSPMALLARCVAMALDAVAVVVGCKVPGKRQAFSLVGPQAATLRDAFDADVGKVRLIVLVSPT